MFGWLQNCFSSSKKSRFDQVRMECTYPDWRAPNPASLSIILNAMSGKDEQITEEQALNNILSHLEREDEMKSPPYLLKNLYLLDRITSEHLGLRKISTYVNSQLLNLDPKISQNLPVLRDLITLYYSFVKEKAKAFGMQSIQLREPSSRESFLKELPTSGLLNEINSCFKIQNMILTLSERFKSGNKSSEIIQAIFCSLLWTYLYCYSVVSNSVKEFSRRIPELSHYDLEYLKKLTVFLLKEYTRNFLIFIDSNKAIDAFKNIKYNELNIVDEKLLSVIEAQMERLKEHEQIQIVFPDYNHENYQEFEPNEEQNEGGNDSDDDRPAHKIKLEIDLTKSMRDLNSFFKYKNFYHEDFLIEDEEENSPAKEQQNEKRRKFGVKSKLSLYDGIKEKSERAFSMENSHIYDRQEWDNWVNIYSGEAEVAAEKQFQESQNEKPISASA